MWEVSTGGMVASVVWGVCLAWVLEYFQVSCETVIILFVMLFLDYVFWILDAYLKDKQSVTSTKMRQGFRRKMTRWMLPLIVIAILRGVGAWDLEMASTVIYSILIITEGYSIIGHFFSINTGKELPEIDAFEMLIRFITNLLKGKLPEVKDKDLDSKE